MIKALLFDFARVLIFPKDKTYSGGINDLNRELSKTPNYKLLEYFELNIDLLKYLKAINDRVPVYMFTSELIQEDPAIKGQISGVFSKIYSAQIMGVSKKEVSTYSFIATDLNLNTNQILFIDDNSENIEAAKIAGMETVQYKDNSMIDLITEIVNR